MPGRALTVALLLTTALATPSVAAPPPQQALSSAAHPVSWSGTLATPDPFGCGGPVSRGCDTTNLTVKAAKGSWITVSTDDPNGYLLVRRGADYVASGGEHLSTSSTATPTATVTFQQVTSGRVTYAVGVSSIPATAVTPITYTATARLAGRAFDREGECGATTGAEHLRDPDDGRVLPLSVRLVAEPKDTAAVRRAGTGLIEIYGRVGIAVTVSYDFVVLKPLGNDTYAYEQIRRRYGGIRPRGVDVVHVLTDQFPGGYADCIGGIAYPEKAFSVGNVHYTVQGTVPVDQVPAAMVAGHEIGHLLGAQHQQVNCAEALPQQAAKPASDGWVGPCTLMGPAALNDSETFSTLERTTVRAYARRFAGR